MFNIFQHKNIFKEKHVKFFLISILSFFILSYVVDIKPFLFLIVLCILNVILMLYDRYVELPIDIELSTFSATLMTIKFGLFWGILAGLLTKIVVIISNKDFNKNSIFSLSAYALVAVFANILKDIHFLTLGIIIAFLVNFYVFLVFKFLLFLSDYEIFMYSSTNIVFNIIVFIIFSNFSLFFHF